jgi:hypothetical protein
MIFKRYSPALQTILLITCMLSINPAMGHGGVVLDEDLCVISIGFLRAHFTVYQPETSDNEEYCENIPDVTGSVFVMEYLHDFLRQMPVDFRIVRDVNDVGEFAKWEDIEAIDDLEAATVFYQSSRVQTDGNFVAEYSFEEKGTYIGVVTATHPVENKIYNSVFYFRVGGPNLGTVPIFIGLFILLQMIYWLSNGGWQRVIEARSVKT